MCLDASIVSVHGPPLRHFELLKLLNFDFNADPDPAFHSNADLDPDLAAKNKADPDQHPYCWSFLYQAFDNVPTKIPVLEG